MYAKIWNYLRGSVRFQCESIAPERVLNLCAVHEIPFWDVQWQTAERFTLRTTREGARLLEAVAAETDAVLQRLDERGAPLVLRRMRRRAAQYHHSYHGRRYGGRMRHPDDLPGRRKRIYCASSTG